MKKLKRMKDRILSIVLTFVMVMSLFVGLEPMDAYAADSNHTHNGITYQAINSSNYRSKLEQGGNYYLAENINISSHINIKSGTVNLCLNGKTISASNNNSSLFYVENATLNIYDCNGNGTLTGGKGFNNKSNKGGAIYMKTAQLNMYGGTITGNSAAWGGAVFIDGSEGRSEFNMYGGTISGNTATSGGGAIEVENTNSYLNLYGGSIVNNSVTSTDSGLHKGGGVHFANGTVRIYGTSGDVIIKDNKVEGKDNNLYLRSGKAITIANNANITSNSSIGISSEDCENSSISKVTITNGAITDKNRCFFLDGMHSSDYLMEYNSSGLAIFKKNSGSSSHTHNNIKVQAVAATCIEDGNEEYYKCSTCDSLFTTANGTTSTTLASVKINKLGHDMSNATCIEASKCQREGCDYIGETSLGHDMSEATCTEASKCKRDGCDYTEGTSLGHNMSNATCIKESECQRDGCDYIEGTELGHDISEATCTEGAECQREDCAYTVDALGHNWTGEWTTIKEATATETGKKETICVNGCGHKRVATIPKLGEIDDVENLEKEAEVNPEAPIAEATLNNSKQELLNADSIFSESEKSSIQAGEDVRVWLEISKTNEQNIGVEDKTKMEEEASKIMGEDTMLTYFDVDLFKQVGNGVKQEITEPGIAMKITIRVPSKLLNSDKKVLREYKIIRLHEGQVDVINGNFDATTGEFMFESDKFSTYAIVYKDIPLKDNDDDNSIPGDDDGNSIPGDDDGNSIPGDGDVIKPEDEKKDEVPETGDSNTTLYSFILMLLSGAGIMLCSRKMKILNKES